MKRVDYNRKYYLDHREQLLQRRRDWYVNNRERALATHARWRDANYEACRLANVLGIKIAQARKLIKFDTEAKGGQHVHVD